MSKKLNFQIQIDEKIPMKLQGDVTRIKQILLNVLSNAVKFTNEGSVAFNCEFENVSENSIRFIISVADTGMGIRKEELENLFVVIHDISPDLANCVLKEYIKTTKQIMEVEGKEFRETIEKLQKERFRIKK